MRALTGAIITTGALIGLGLTAIGFGNRYSSLYLRDTTNNYVRLAFRETDPMLMGIFIMLLIAMCIGFGLTFIGLAYHHHRRHHEHLHRERTHAGSLS